MDEFSLETISEQIHNGKTKSYFKEVLSSYHNGNYRSSVVMLWSVAICDIVYKLQDLIDLYEDPAAKKILEELTDIQSSDPRSSVWELRLLDDVHKNTYLLDTSEYENLRYLQKQRHLSSHPVLNLERELHSPNKETVRSLLRNTLEDLLIKPPIYTQRILKELLEDLSESANVLNNRGKVKKYIESKYLNRMKQKVEINIFRSLWKLVFKLNDENCEQNRQVNFRALLTISNRNRTIIPNLIELEKEYYCNIASSGSPLSFFVYYISLNSEIYKVLNDNAKLKIDHCIETDYVGKTVGWFTKVDLDAHVRDVENWIKSDEQPIFTLEQCDALLEISDTDEWQQKFCKIVTTYYTESHSFNQADNRFQIAIPKYISLFDKESLIYLANKIEDNSQCYSRGQAREDYKIIKSRIDEVFNDDFPYEKFPSFHRRLIINDEMN